MPQLSARGYAKRIGVSGSYVSRLVREGKLTIDAEGRIDAEAADRVLAANREPARRAKRSVPSEAQATQHTNATRRPPSTSQRPVERFTEQSSSGPADLATLLLKARTKTEVEKGKLLEQKAKAGAAKLVDADEIRAAAFNKARIVRDALLNLAARLAPLVAAETNERACFELIDREVRQALEELAGPA